MFLTAHVTTCCHPPPFLTHLTFRPSSTPLLTRSFGHFYGPHTPAEFDLVNILKSLKLRKCCMDCFCPTSFVFIPSPLVFVCLCVSCLWSDLIPYATELFGPVGRWCPPYLYSYHLSRHVCTSLFQPAMLSTPPLFFPSQDIHSSSKILMVGWTNHTRDFCGNWLTLLSPCFIYTILVNNRHGSFSGTGLLYATDCLSPALVAFKPSICGCLAWLYINAPPWHSHFL